MNNYLFRVYHDENNSWRSTLEVQCREIPGMSRILAQIVKDHPGERFSGNAKHLQRKLEEQETSIKKITGKIDEQQQKLESVNDAAANTSTLETLYQQEALRDEVLKFEKGFLDFKQSFHQYLLTVI